MFLKKLTALIVIGSVLAGCSMNNREIGTLTGGAIGGLVGSRFGGGAGQALATGVGVLAGAYIGGKIGENMDEVDRMKMNNTLERVPTGQSHKWSNPDTGTEYTVVPTRTYKRQVGNAEQPCREFTTTALIGGKQERVYGKACRTADGSWKMIQ